MELRTREHLTGRPEPDEAELEPVRLLMRDLLSAAKRAAMRMLDDNMMLIASALAYSVFFAIPAVLLVALGLFTLVASPSPIDSLIHRLSHVIPTQATDLLSGSLHRPDEHPSTPITITVVRLVLAVWAVTGAMNSFLT